MAETKFNAIDGFSVGPNGISVIDSTASVTANAITATGNVAFTGANVSLGSEANLRITGGIAGYVLSTDGSGNLAWNQPGSGSSVIISNTPPTSPTVGDLWWDSEIGTLFIYYNDGDSSQWVEASPQILIEGPAGTFTLSGNLVITEDVTIQGTLYETSDASLKRCINTIKDPLLTTNNLRGVTFNWIKNDKQSMGMIAQEVEKVVPYLVQSDVTGTKTINYTAMIGLLIESIKELNNKIEKLEHKKTLWQKIKDILNGN